MPSKDMLRFGCELVLWINTPLIESCQLVVMVIHKILSMHVIAGIFFHFVRIVARIDFFLDCVFHFYIFEFLQKHKHMIYKSLYETFSGYWLEI